ncbi:MAG TPA: imidazole glycerol phosphate synthase subunit HisH [Fibrobacteria bacterium]|nr:imidazole glycerol phosphate synthase subunit HisH [Fibrobacteria bacterium]HOX52495.1 imidazole glycerol phosphate synthase subunit HisH [Fibrobacteria bacterium]
MTILVDYKAGNLTSVSLALSKVGVPHSISDDPEVVRRADRVVFPGVGAAGQAMDNLRSTGMDQALVEVVRKGHPVLGICIGCQILLDSSEENGGVRCLGILPGRVRRFDFAHLAQPRPKVPHMGWNPVSFHREHPVLAGIPNQSHFYFVHSFYPDPLGPEVRLGSTGYGDLEFTSILDGGNVVATQFHTEKSGESGLRLLANFGAWKP